MQRVNSNDISGIQLVLTKMDGKNSLEVLIIGFTKLQNIN
jgi:hypothetical protein